LTGASSIIIANGIAYDCLVHLHGIQFPSCRKTQPKKTWMQSVDKEQQQKKRKKNK